MKIESIKELDKIIALCRKRGVQSIRIDNIEFHLGEVLPLVTSSKKSQVITPTYAPGGITAETKIDMPDELTPEQMLMWSVGGNPEAL